MCVARAIQSSGSCDEEDLICPLGRTVDVKSLIPHLSPNRPVRLAAGATNGSLVASPNKHDDPKRHESGCLLALLRVRLEAEPTSWRFLNVDDYDACYPTFADGGFMFHNFG